jgi:hypothetical protein
VIADSNSWTGNYVDIPSGGNFNYFNNMYMLGRTGSSSPANQIIAGSNIPAGPVVVEFSYKCPSLTSFLVNIKANGTTVGAVTPSCTTSYQTATVSADFTGYSGDAFGFALGAGEVDIAWMAIVPLGNVNAKTVTLAGATSGSYVKADGTGYGTPSSTPTGSATGDLSGTYPGPSVAGLKSVPFCTGFTPTNGQYLQYTTGGSPNPCYTAATGSSSGVTQLLAGTGISLSPSGGTGVVTVTNTGSGGFTQGSSGTTYWEKDPLGVITEWGSLTINNNSGTLGTGSIIFPLAFTNVQSLTVTAGSTPDSSGDNSLTAYYTSLNTSGATAVLRCAVNIGGSGCSALSNTIPVTWIAKGN